MYADDAINVINKYRTKEIVLTTMTPGRYWKEISENLKLIFLFTALWAKLQA